MTVRTFDPTRARLGRRDNRYRRSDDGRYGSGIVEFDSTEAAGKCVLLSEKEEVMGRPIRVRAWEEKGGGDKKPAREMSARPDNCTTIFCGNLDYNIDDDKVSLLGW
eukprot:672529-Prorocentrum_minimum.AAC.1